MLDALWTRPFVLLAFDSISNSVSIAPRPSPHPPNLSYMLITPLFMLVGGVPTIKAPMHFHCCK